MSRYNLLVLILVGETLTLGHYIVKDIETRRELEFESETRIKSEKAANKMLELLDRITVSNSRCIEEFVSVHQKINATSETVDSQFCGNCVENSKAFKR